MLFSATHACPTCRLRFQRRERCPECDGTRILPLTTERDRAELRRLLKRSRAVGGSVSSRVLMTLSEWAPAQLWFPLGFGVLLVLPAALMLLDGTDSFLDLWFVTEAGRFSTERRGLSSHGFEAIGAGCLGLVLLVATAATRYARAMAAGKGEGAAGPDAAKGRLRPGALRVHAPPRRESDPARELRGFVRSASATQESPLDGVACVFYGLHGDADGTPIDDAEGGDFDLELASGERVLVSLEHAVLIADDPGTPEPRENDDRLDELLDARGVGGGRASFSLAEVVVCEGDEIAIDADVTGGPALSLGYRAPSRIRVASGTAESPLVVRVGKRAS